MTVIKKPLKKIIKKSGSNKLVKSKLSLSEKGQRDVTEFHDDVVVEQQPNLQAQQEANESLGLQPAQPKIESLEPQTEANQLKHSLVNDPKLVIEKVANSVEVREALIAWKETLTPIVPIQKASCTETAGVATVVFDRNSKRAKLKRIITDGLNSPDYIKFYVTDNEFVVQASTADEENSYKLRAEGKRKCIIYNSELIKLLIKIFALDFSKSTSQSFGEVKFKCIEGVDYAVIF